MRRGHLLSPAKHYRLAGLLFADETRKRVAINIKEENKMDN
jgi:hypothetical protein